MKGKHSFNQDFVNSKKINNKFLPQLKRVLNNQPDNFWKEDLVKTNDCKLSRKSRKHISFYKYFNRNTEDPKNENDLNNSYLESYIL